MGSSPLKHTCTMYYTMFRTIFNIYILPTTTQIGLQQSQSIQMDLISAFYDEITFYLIVILTFVSYMLVRALWVYTSEKKSLSLTQGHELEFIWTTIPSIILAAIAIPSFILLYQLDLSYKPDMTLKVIGHQWYWSYEYPRSIPCTPDPTVLARFDRAESLYTKGMHSTDNPALREFLQKKYLIIIFILCLL